MYTMDSRNSGKYQNVCSTIIGRNGLRIKKMELSKRVDWNAWNIQPENRSWRKSGSWHFQPIRRL